MPIWFLLFWSVSEHARALIFAQEEMPHSAPGTTYATKEHGEPSQAKETIENIRIFLHKNRLVGVVVLL